MSIRAALARHYRKLLIGLLVVHIALLAWSASVHSPVIDEPAHLAAGLSHWQVGDFALYRVNPPLVRMVATSPLLRTSIKTDWKGLRYDLRGRAEFSGGAHLVNANGSAIFWYVTVARCACIPFSLIGAVVCYRWARLLFGKAAGLLAATLWCFSPTVLAHGSLMTPDCAATAVGLAACYTFWRWLMAPSFGQSTCAGIVLGAAEACKSTWIILFGLFPVIWLAYRLGFARGQSKPAGAQLAAILAIAWWLLLSAYGWQGVGASVGELTLRSSLFRRAFGEEIGNGEYRVRPAVAKLPLPLPLDYVIGLDTQARDLEGPNRSFLRGEWRTRGWWYYYVYGLAVKEPVGALALAVISLTWWFMVAFRAKWRRRFSLRRTRFLAASALMTVCPLAVLISASASTGMNHHVRYVMPVVPYLYVLGSGLAVRRGPWAAVRRTLSYALGAYMVVSSLWAFPHSLSYFSELAGGPVGGFRHLNNSNIDWGQDLLFLREWKRRHEPDEPIYLAYFGRVNPKYAGIDFHLPPLLARTSNPSERPEAVRNLQPGWYAVSVTLLQGRGYIVPKPEGGAIWANENALAYFRDLEPAGRVGYSIYIYRVEESRP